MNNSSKFAIKYSKVLKALMNICFFFIVAFVIYGIAISPKLNIFYEEAHVYDEDWIKENPDGSEKIFKMPTSMPLSENETVTISTILPDTVKDGMYLAIHTGKSFVVYVDGEEIYSFDNNVSMIPGQITKTLIIPIPLKEDYAGKKLSLAITDGKYRRPIINTAYIGTLMGIVIVLLNTFIVQFLLAILLVIAALITIVVFVYIEKRDGKNAPLIYLAEGVLAISLWIISDSPLFQIVTGKFFFDGPWGFMLVVMMCLPFFFYFDDISEYKSHKIFVACESLMVLNFIVLSTLHFTNVLSFPKVLIYVDLVLLAYIIVIIVCTLRNYFIQSEKKHTHVIIGLIGLSIFASLEIFITIINASIPLRIDISGLFVLVGMVFLLVFAILDQVKVLEVLKQETQNAIAATKAKSDFLANMSHEIRTPINAIMGMNEMILRESDQASVKDYAKDISSASENLLSIINDILDFSKIESGKLEIINDDYDLGEIIYDVISLVNMKAENKGLKLNVNIDENLPTKLYGDDKRVREIITNILNNAVKYTEKGFVNLSITGKAEENIILLKIVVADSGQGIKEEDLDKIFSGFSQVNTKKNKNIEGTGLGLPITKHLVELMDGSIDVDSIYGSGSKFTIFLPQEIASDEKMGDYRNHRHASVKNETVDSKEVNLENVSILVVDDTELNLKVIKKLFTKTKANVTCASSGAEMLKLVKVNHYDVILLDHMMPNMDGIETLAEFKTLDNNMCKDVPVIALTANAIVGAKEMYLDAGFDDYLSKPIKMDLLCDMLVKYLPEDMVKYE